MRISDWSSDVCSSDLDRSTGETGPDQGVVSATRTFSSFDGRLDDFVRGDRGRRFGIFRKRGITMKTHSTSQLRGFAKSALLVSVAFPLSTLIAVSPAHADESVTVNSAETANDVNAKIGAAQAGTEEHTSELQSLMRI